MTIVQSVKNTHDEDLTISGTKNVTTLAVAVEVGGATKITGKEVPVGAKIFSVELWVNYVAGSTITGNFKWYLGKSRSGQSITTDFPLPAFTAIGLSGFRNQIFHQETALVGTEDAGPYKFHRRIKLPPPFQRFRAGDNLFIVTQADTAGLQSVAILYKYYQ